MSNFTPLYGSILTSTIWAEDAETRLVWITMLAMADASGYVGASIPGLAHAARVSVDGCRNAIGKFLGPDPDSRTKENDGRRIDVADGGWRLLNYERHRERATEIRHNVLSALRMRELRKRRKEQKVANVPEQEERLHMLPNVPQAEAEAEAEAENTIPTLYPPDPKPAAKPRKPRLELAPEPGKGPTWFEELWARFPVSGRQRSSRAKCWTVWKRDSLEAQGVHICDVLEGYLESTQWLKDAGQYVPAADRWLREKKYLESVAQ